MQRRSFLFALVGGLTAAASGATTALAAPAPGLAQSPLSPNVLDQVDAEFSHMPPGPRARAHREWHRRRWARRRARRRMRRAWRRGRWYYY